MTTFKAGLVLAISIGLCLECARADVDGPGVLTDFPQGASDFLQYGDFANGQPQNIHANSGVPLDDLFTTTFPSTVTENPGSISVLFEGGENEGDPFVALNATVDGSSLNASVSLTYYVEVLDTRSSNPVPDANVDVDVNGDLVIGAPGNGTGLSASASAGFKLWDASNNLLLNESTAGEYQTSADLNVGEVYTVTLSAAASMFDQSGEFTIQAGSDPTFSLTGPDASDYEIIYSPGVAAVPEPSAWTLMLVGLLGLGVVAYRKKVTGRSA